MSSVRALSFSHQSVGLSCIGDIFSGIGKFPRWLPEMSDNWFVSRFWGMVILKAERE
jgi:hypothetical protein